MKKIAVVGLVTILSCWLSHVCIAPPKPQGNHATTQKTPYQAELEQEYDDAVAARKQAESDFDAARDALTQAQAKLVEVDPEEIVKARQYVAAAEAARDSAFELKTAAEEEESRCLMALTEFEEA